MKDKLYEEFLQWKREHPDKANMTKEEMVEDIRNTIIWLINNPHPKRKQEILTEEQEKEKRKNVEELVDVLADLGIIRIIPDKEKAHETK